MADVKRRAPYEHDRRGSSIWKPTTTLVVTVSAMTDPLFRFPLFFRSSCSYGLRFLIALSSHSLARFLAGIHLFARSFSRSLGVALPLGPICYSAFPLLCCII